MNKLSVCYIGLFHALANMPMVKKIDKKSDNKYRQLIYRCMTIVFLDRPSEGLPGLRI